MKQLGAAVAAILGFGAVGTSCVILIGGNKDYVEVDGGGTSGATGGGASSSSGTGGSGGTTTSTSSAQSSSSSGNPCQVQHPGGGTCEYLPGITCGCTGTKKCSVVDDTSGASGCVFAGSTPEYGRCTSDNDCHQGSWCNHATSACQPICVQNADCTSGGQCLPALQTDGSTPIPGLRVCTAHCDLVTAAPCTGGLTCVSLDAIKEFDCHDSLNVQKGGFCSTDTDCKAGLWCSNMSSTCIPWCAPATTSGSVGSAGCSSGQFCYSFSPPIKSSTVEYGFCL